VRRWRKLVLALTGVLLAAFIVAGPAMADDYNYTISGWGSYSCEDFGQVRHLDWCDIQTVHRSPEGHDTAFWGGGITSWCSGSLEVNNPAGSLQVTCTTEWDNANSPLPLALDINCDVYLMDGHQPDEIGKLIHPGTPHVKNYGNPVPTDRQLEPTTNVLNIPLSNLAKMPAHPLAAGVQCVIRWFILAGDNLSQVWQTYSQHIWLPWMMPVYNNQNNYEFWEFGGAQDLPGMYGTGDNQTHLTEWWVHNAASPPDSKTNPW